MTDIDRIFTYGTAETPPTCRAVTAGATSALIEGGALRQISCGTVELVRQIDFPIRDESWATFTPEVTFEDLSETKDGFRFEQRFIIDGGALECRVVYSASADGSVTAMGEAKATRDFTTNRSGFTLLHPIVGVAGHPVVVTAPDGETTDTVMPELISPAQPIKNIAGLGFEINGVTLDIRFAGEVFEMEDQRNWSDASYKTYCRPLVEPFAYVISKGETLRQEIHLSINGADVSSDLKHNAAPSVGPTLNETLPELIFAAEPGWLPDDQDLRAVAQSGVNSLLLRVTAENAADLVSKAANFLQTTGGNLDLEILLNDADSIEEQLQRIVAACDAVGRTPRHVIALPEPYLQSYQPGGTWPTGHSPDQAVKAARIAFPDSKIGAGMLTNFTEFNRCRPQVEDADYITHGNSAIVHAADDTSVNQTLETLPDIFASASAIGRGRPYRLGLTAIGMRSNPYGASVSANPNQSRITMATWDPRARALFGAAWAVGALATTEGAKVASIALAAPVGPFGVIKSAAPFEQPWFDETPEAKYLPMFHVLKALSNFDGPRHSINGLPKGLTGIVATNGTTRRVLIANISEHRVDIQTPQADLFAVLDTTSFHAATQDAEWLETTLQTAPPDTFQLERASVLFLDINENPKANSK
ncbi:MAG: hypothetical protein ACSHXD_07815 [Marinosulfonomonas sp.]